MATISVSGNKKIGTLRKEFNEQFPYLRLGIYYSYMRETVAKGDISFCSSWRFRRYNFYQRKQKNQKSRARVRYRIWFVCTSMLYNKRR